MGDRLVKVTDLKNDDTYKIRPLNEDAITRYMQIYENGKEKSIIIQKGTNRIIDGYHRVEACRRLDREKIKVKVVDLPDREIRSKSFKINNGHGVPLSLDERNQLITKLYTEDGKTQAQIAKITGLGQPRIAQILALLITNNTNNEDKRVKLEESDYPTIVRLILGGENQQQIAERFNVDQSRISQVWSNIRDSIHKEYTEGKQLKRDLAKNHDLTINEVDKILQGYEDPLNFDLQQNTLWPAFGLDDRFGQEHGSNLPALLIKNILALYTKPGDIILDPAAGGGVVRDAAEDMVNRKSYLFDLTPKRDEIRRVILSSNSMYQAMFLSMFQGAMDQEMVTYWSANGYDNLVEQLKGDPEVVKVDLPGRKARKFKGEGYYTFIAGDAIKALRTWIKQRQHKVETGKIPGDSRAIFCNQYGETISKRTIREYWTAKLRRLGIIEPVKRGTKISRTGKGLHEMRDVFRSLWSKSPASHIVGEYCMGHQIDKLNYDKSFLDVKFYHAEYVKALPYLQLISQGEAFGRVDKSEVERLRRELEEAKRTKSDEVQQLTARLDRYEKMFEELYKRLPRET